MNYDFDQVIDRRETDAIKLEGMKVTAEDINYVSGIIKKKATSRFTLRLFCGSFTFRTVDLIFSFLFLRTKLRFCLWL